MPNFTELEEEQSEKNEVEEEMQEFNIGKVAGGAREPTDEA